MNTLLADTINVSSFDGLLNLMSIVYRFFMHVVAFLNSSLAELVSTGASVSFYDPFTMGSFTVNLFPPQVEIPIISNVIQGAVKSAVELFFGSQPLYVVLLGGGLLVAFLYNAVKNFF